LAVKHELHGDVDVTVISQSDLFVFNPSLIWLPFGKRSPQDLSFPVTPTLEHHGIEFIHHAAESIDATARTVSAGGQSYPYDYLVIATGYRNDFDVAPGLGPGGNAVTITTLEDAVHAGERWKALLDDPGPVVVAATQRASCFGAAYEFLFNAAYHLKKAKLKGKVPLTYVTSEPFLGHFGIGGLPHGEQLLGMFLKMEGITAITDASIEYVDTDAVHLKNGQDVPMRYSMVIPPFLGQQSKTVASRTRGVMSRSVPRTRARTTTTSTPSASRQQ